MATRAARSNSMNPILPPPALASGRKASTRACKAERWVSALCAFEKSTGAAPPDLSSKTSGSASVTGGSGSAGGSDSATAADDAGRCSTAPCSFKALSTVSRAFGFSLGAGGGASTGSVEGVAGSAVSTGALKKSSCSSVATIAAATPSAGGTHCPSSRV